jgi:uncharacterized oligopeptide transporter (OPT) family protein
MPGATIWKAVAEALTKGLSALHPSAQIAALVGAVLGIVIEFMNQRMKGKFPVSAIGLGLAFVLRFTDSIAMALGAFFFWWCTKRFKNHESTGYRVFVENSETLCAGVIAGGSIIGILLIILETVVFGN